MGNGTRGILRLFTKIPGNIIDLTFREIFIKTPGNLQEDSGKCTRCFRGMLLRILEKKLYGPFLWVRFNYLKATATLRRQFSFYY